MTAQEQTVGQSLSHHYLRVLWNGRYKMLAGAGICGLSFLILIFILPMKYRSSATVLIYPPTIKEKSQPVPKEAPSSEKPTERTELASLMPLTFPVETFQAIATSPDMLQEVIDTLRLDNMLVENLQKDIQISLVELGSRTAQYGTVYSQALMFSGKATKPQLAADIVQTWADLFKKRMDDIVVKSIDETSTLIEGMHTETKAKLDTAETALETFRKEWNLELIKREREEKEKLLAELEIMIDRDEIEIARSTKELESWEALLANQERIDTLFKAPPDEAYWVARQLSGAKGTPPFGAKDGLRVEIHNPEYQFYVQYRASVESSLRATEAKRDEIRKRLEKVRTEITKLQKDQAEQTTVETRLLRDVETFKSTYVLVAQTKEKSKIAKANRQSDIVIVGKAVVPTKPAGPTSPLKALMAAFAGLMLSCAYTIGLDILRRAGLIAQH